MLNPMCDLRGKMELFALCNAVYFNSNILIRDMLFIDAYQTAYCSSVGNWCALRQCSTELDVTWRSAGANHHLQDNILNYTFSLLEANVTQEEYYFSTIIVLLND